MPIPALQVSTVDYLPEVIIAEKSIDFIPLLLERVSNFMKCNTYLITFTARFLEISSTLTSINYSYEDTCGSHV